MKIIWFIRFFILAALLQSCFSRYAMSEKELRAHYAGRTNEPEYHRIVNDSLSLFCAVRGADTLPPLLLIHGAPGAWYGSRNFLEDTCLTNHFQVIAPDRPGYNKTRFKRKRKAITSIALQARLLHQALQLNHSGKKAVVVGSSYGGPIAARLAMDHPESYEAAVLLAAAVDPQHETLWWFHPLVWHGPIKWCLPHFMKSATDEKHRHIRELQELEPYWKTLAVPLIALQGGADQLVSPVNLDYLKLQLAGKRACFYYLPEAGHFIRWQYPDLVVSLLLNNPLLHTATSNENPTGSGY